MAQTLVSTIHRIFSPAKCKKILYFLSPYLLKKLDEIMKIPVSDEPVSDKPVYNKPVSDESVSDKLVSDKPVSDKPVSDKPVSD